MPLANFPEKKLAGNTINLAFPKKVQKVFKSKVCPMYLPIREHVTSALLQK